MTRNELIRLLFNGKDSCYSEEDMYNECIIFCLEKAYNSLNNNLKNMSDYKNQLYHKSISVFDEMVTARQHSLAEKAISYANVGSCKKMLHEIADVVTSKYSSLTYSVKEISDDECANLSVSEMIFISLLIKSCLLLYNN